MMTVNDHVSSAIDKFPIVLPSIIIVAIFSTLVVGPHSREALQKAVARLAITLIILCSIIVIVFTYRDTVEYYDSDLVRWSMGKPTAIMALLVCVIFSLVSILLIIIDRHMLVCILGIFFFFIACAVSFSLGEYNNIMKGGSDRLYVIDSSGGVLRGTVVKLLEKGVLFVNGDKRTTVMLIPWDHINKIESAP